MDRGYVKLTDDQYMRMKDMTHAEVTSALEGIIPDSIRYGYGYYGFNRFEVVDGVAYAEIATGSSCD